MQEEENRKLATASGENSGWGSKQGSWAPRLNSFNIIATRTWGRKNLPKNRKIGFTKRKEGRKRVYPRAGLELVLIRDKLSNAVWSKKLLTKGPFWGQATLPS